MLNNIEYKRTWAKNNPDKIASYALKHKEKKLARSKEYYKENKDKILAKRKVYSKSEEGKKVQKAASKKYRKENRSKINKYNSTRLNIPEIKIAKNLRIRLSMAMRSQKTRKTNQTMKYVGCTKEELRLHLQSLFLEGMSWDNYGNWHIDHIVPISSFNLGIDNNIYKAMNYTNLQPLWAQDNLSKSNKML